MIQSSSILGLEPLVLSAVFWEQQVNVSTVGMGPWNATGQRFQPQTAQSSSNADDKIPHRLAECRSYFAKNFWV